MQIPQWSHSISDLGSVPTDRSIQADDSYPATGLINELFHKVELAKQEWEATMDALPQLVTLLNGQGQILRVNRTFERWGLGRLTEARGRELHDLLHRDCDRASCTLRSLLAQQVDETSTPEVIEVETDSAGLERSLLIQLQHVDRQHPIAEGTRVVVVHDITRQKQAEVALRRYSQILVDQNKELDAFAHTVAHDLQNPLGALMGTAELLVELYDDFTAAEIMDNLSLIAQSARKAMNIIEELMLLTSVRKETVEPVPIDMSPIVTDALNQLKDVIRQSEAQITKPESWPSALGYAPWIEEVWVNYLSNGIKYGGTPPRLELGANVEPDGTVRFWVCDNGVGVAPNQHERIFAPFSRLQQVRAQGYGLGLSIVQRIVAKLGGQVGVESDGNSGSLFYFTLPAGDPG